MKLSQASISALLQSDLTVLDTINILGIHGIWVKEVESDEDFYIDESFFKQLGYDDQSVDWKTLLHESSKLDFFSFVKASEAELKKSKDSIFGFTDSNSTIRWFSFNVLFLSDNGKVFQIFMVKDITEFYAQKNNQKRNSRSLELNQLLTKQNDIILVIDDELTFIDYVANDAELLFHAPAEFIGKKVYEMELPNQVTEKILVALETIRKTNKRQIINYSLEINEKTEFFTIEVTKHIIAYSNLIEYVCLITNISEEINKEIEDKKQGEKLHALFSVIEDLKIIFDRNGNYKEVIATKDELLIDSKEFLIGKNITDFFEQSEASKLQRVFNLSFLLKKEQKLTYHRTIKNEVHFFEARIFPLEANNEILVFIRDCTEETHIQEKIKQDQELLHKLSQHLPGCFYVFERSANKTFFFNYLSEAFLKIIPEINIHDITKDFNLLYPFFHKDDFKPLIKAIEQSAADLTLFSFEFRMHVPANSKQLKWIKAKSMPELKKDGSIIWHGYLEDITKEKLHEQQILENENRYRYLFSNNPQPMMIFDSDTLQILEVNNTASYFYGYSRDEFLSMTILDLHFEEEIDSTVELIRSIETKIKTFRYQKHKKKNGELVYVGITSHSLDFNNSKARHAVITDFTEIVEKETKINAISQEFERVFNGTQESLKLIEYFPDGDFRFVRSNTNYQEATGLSLESIRGKTPYEVFTKEIGSEKIERYKEALITGKPIEYEEYVDTKDGERIWKTTLSPYITKSSGVYLVSSSVDITRQIEAERSLAETIKKLEFTIDAAQFGSWDWDLETNKTTYSKNIATMIGYELSEVEQNASFYLNLLHPNDINHVTQVINNVLSKSELDSYKVEFRIKTKEEKWKWIESHGKVISRNEFGKATFISGVSHDITERKEQEFNLLRISTFLTQTSEVSQVGGWEFDFTNNSVHWSEVVNKIHDFPDSYQERINKSKHFNELLNFYKEGENRDKIKLHFQNLTTKHIPFDDELAFISANGSEKWIRVIAKAEVINGFSTKLYGSITDVTEQKNNYIQIQKLLDLTHYQNQKLKEYTYLTSHNLRLPIANLISLCALMKDDEEKEKYIDMIDQSAQKLNDTMTVMHDILVIEQGKESEVKEAVHVELAILRNYELIVNLLSSEIEFTTDIDSTLFVHVIPAYFDSILNNLITNAIKYKKTDSKAFIHISAEIDTDFVLIKIADQGLGFDMRFVEKNLFKLYHRFHKHIEGRGIGLYYSKSQIDAMGGKIEVMSETNVGSTFSVWLPLAKNEEQIESN